MIAANALPLALAGSAMTNNLYNWFLGAFVPDALTGASSGKFHENPPLLDLVRVLVFV